MYVRMVGAQYFVDDNSVVYQEWIMHYFVTHFVVFFTQDTQSNTVKGTEEINHSTFAANDVTTYWGRKKKKKSSYLDSNFTEVCNWKSI